MHANQSALNYVLLRYLYKLCCMLSRDTQRSPEGKDRPLNIFLYVWVITRTVNQAVSGKPREVNKQWGEEVTCST